MTFWSVGGMKIYEPATIITSLGITGLCLIFYLKIEKNSPRKDIQSWKLFFLFMFLGSVFGIFYHGLRDQFGEKLFNYLNLVRNIFLLLSCFYAFKGTLFYVEKREKLLRSVNLGLTIYMIIVIIVTVILNHFFIVIINTGLFVIYILIVHTISYKRGSKGSAWILGAFAMAPFPIAVHLLKLGFGDYFNSKDVAHVFIWISLALIYKGVVEMSKENSTTLLGKTQ
jgi:hypothetical protein